MDLSQVTLNPQALAGPLTAIAAASAGITILTQIVKQYTDPQRVPPPLIAALIAALFTAALQLAQPEHPTWRDAFPILMTWVGLLQTAIGVYHGAKLTLGGEAEQVTRDRIQSLHDFYDKLLTMKDRQLAEQAQMIRVVPMPVPTASPEAPPPPPPPETNFYTDGSDPHVSGRAA